ncbi:MAG: HNH endonuclease [Candidatus Marinimicrobia bacterium]|nr:HNH endonuclease [Candidatus Neomarinimicrobiota bacterium]
MAITLSRQITDSEKKLILARFGRKCYATGHEINDDFEIQFDHIKAFSEKGVSEIDNIAPMCKEHNLKKGRLPLEDFRTKLKMEEFFSRGQTLTLKDELQYFKDDAKIKGYGQSCYIKIEGDQIELEANDIKTTHRLYKCPTTGWHYFFALLPVEVINSDDDEDGEIGLQPRYLIIEKVFNLYRHFQKHPVLQPSLGRFYKDKVLIFDGQHKIASMLWGGRQTFEIKVYIDPDPQVLNNTNIAAHDKFAQTRFYSSIMVSKLGSQFGKQFEDYKNKEDGQKKSESGFLQYLRTNEQFTVAEANKRFYSFLYNLVLDPEVNKVSGLVSKSNRSSTEYPLTVDMLSKSLFSNFLYRYPLEEDLASSRYLREVEVSNTVQLFNIIFEEALFAWDSKKDSRDTTQNKLSRMFRSKSIMSWAEILKDAVAAKLDIIDGDEKAMLFYRELSESDFEKIRSIIRRLAEWSVWKSPRDSEIDRVLADNKSEVKKYMKLKGLTAGYLLGAPD